MKIEIKRKTLNCLDNMPKKINKALAKAILVVEAKAKENLYAYGDLGDHGVTARSIYSSASDNVARVGVTDEHGFWYEYGTGSYAIHGDGRKGWWVYIDEEYPHPKSEHRVVYDRAECERIAQGLIAQGVPEKYVHITNGNPPTPFLRPALHETRQQFLKVLAQEISKEVQDDR